MRRFILVATLLLAVGVAFYFLRRGGAAVGSSHPQRSAVPIAPAGSVQPPLTPAPAKSGSAAPTGSGVQPTGATASVAADFPIVAQLNAPTSNIASDLAILQQLFEAWCSNFPRQGNPVGENAEITSALLGENPLGLALVPKDHRALNSRGELCDRWGTPFRFHQLSGTKMEVRSAGPDRKFATSDDSVWTPP